LREVLAWGSGALGFLVLLSAGHGGGLGAPAVWGVVG
jgi:hypothetical protein